VARFYGSGYMTSRSYKYCSNLHTYSQWVRFKMKTTRHN